MQLLKIRLVVTKYDILQICTVYVHHGLCMLSAMRRHIPLSPIAKGMRWFLCFDVVCLLSNTIKPR